MADLAADRSSSVSKTRASKPKLLSGGNPQIEKGDGDGPVQAYLAAMPGWKQEAGRRLDALITRAVPGVQKAVKWNSPFYGIAGQGWFLSFHCFANYIKVAFFRGTSLRPLPPIDSKNDSTRYLHVQDGVALDEKQFVAWVKQATQVPGVELSANNEKAGAPKKKVNPTATEAKTKMSPTSTTRKHTQEPGDWRVEMLDQLRALMLEAHPTVTEEVKWRKPSNGMRGVPVWSHDGIICTGETYKNVVKMTFAKGASLEDPAGLFNSSLEGNTRRAIDFHEGEKINAKALKALIRAAVALNTASRGLKGAK